MKSVQLKVAQFTNIILHNLFANTLIIESQESHSTLGFFSLIRIIQFNEEYVPAVYSSK